jgi:hypothetical protein
MGLTHCRNDSFKLPNARAGEQAAGGAVMRAIAGAILVLAGAVLFGAVAIAEATLAAANRASYSPGSNLCGTVGGALVVLVGLILVATSLFPKPPQPGSDEHKPRAT